MLHNKANFLNKKYLLPLFLESLLYSYILYQFHLNNNINLNSLSINNMFVSGLGTYFLNQKGQTSLIFENNIFHVNRRNENKIFWRCSEYGKVKCKCRCTSIKNGRLITRSSSAHNHPSVLMKEPK